LKIADYLDIDQKSTDKRGVSMTMDSEKNVVESMIWRDCYLSRRCEDLTGKRQLAASKARHREHQKRTRESLTGKKLKYYNDRKVLERVIYFRVRRLMGTHREPVHLINDIGQRTKEHQEITAMNREAAGLEQLPEEKARRKAYADNRRKEREDRFNNGKA